jgi:hypothetical protein
MVVMAARVREHARVRRREGGDQRRARIATVGANAPPERVADRVHRNGRRRLAADQSEPFRHRKQHDARANDLGDVGVDGSPRRRTRFGPDRYFHVPTPRKMMDAAPMPISSPASSRRLVPMA